MAAQGTDLPWNWRTPAQPRESIHGRERETPNPFRQARRLILLIERPLRFDAPIRKRITGNNAIDDRPHTVPIAGEIAHQVIQHNFIVAFELAAQSVGQHLLDQIASHVALGPRPPWPSLHSQISSSPVATAPNDGSPRSDDQSHLRGQPSFSNQTKLSGAPVKGALFEFAPAIDEYLKTHLFGDIFARDNLDWQSREIATVAALAAMPGVESQLQAHIRIGMNVGLSAAQLRG